MILHDVLWPYGRRDLYYSPDNVPKEFRQTNETRGMHPDKKKLLQSGGLNMQLHNAIEEGGPRNGVMTGLEDFMAEYDGRCASSCCRSTSAWPSSSRRSGSSASPALAELLDRLESSDGRLDLLELSEHIRLEAAIFTQNVMRIREEQLVDLGHALPRPAQGRPARRALPRERAPHPAPARLPRAGRAPVGDRAAGPEAPDAPPRPNCSRRLARPAGIRDESGNLLAYFPFTTMGRARLDHLEGCLDGVRTEKVPGDLVECGTGRGGGGIFLRGYLDATLRDARPARSGWPTASGPLPRPPPRPSPWFPVAGRACPTCCPTSTLSATGSTGSTCSTTACTSCRATSGRPCPTPLCARSRCCASGPSWAPAVGDVLDALYDRLGIGGFVVVDDALDPASGSRGRGVPGPPQGARDGRAGRLVGRGFWRQDHRGAGRATPAGPPRRARTHRASWPRARPLAPLPRRPRPAGPLRRRRLLQHEARGSPHAPLALARPTSTTSTTSTTRSSSSRTARTPTSGSAPSSSSRRSAPSSATSTSASRPTRRRCSPSTRASPTLGGRSRRLMIDGAHVLTPRVLHFGMAGTDALRAGRRDHPAVVRRPGPAARRHGRRLRPGVRGRAVRADRVAGQRLPAVRDRALHRRTRLVRRRLGEQLRVRPRGRCSSRCGGFDESFSVAGGGYSNLELYERLGSTPECHRGHDPRRGIVPPGARRHHHQRGRRRRAPRAHRLLRRALRRASAAGASAARTSAIHYVGTMFPEAVRSRSRDARPRAAFFRKLDPNDPDGRPQAAEPIPEDLAGSATSRPTGETWAGRRPRGWAAGSPTPPAT